MQVGRRPHKPAGQYIELPLCVSLRPGTGLGGRPCTPW